MRVEICDGVDYQFFMEKNEWIKIVKSIGMLTQLGLTMLANIGVGFFLGYLADNIFSFDITFKVIGLLLGVGGGFYSIFRLINKFMGDDKNADR